MSTKKIQTLLENRPSVSGNTFFVVAVWIISALLFLFFMVLSIGLLLESAFEYRYFVDILLKEFHLTITDDLARWKFATQFGLISFVTALLFLSTQFLCKMILERNKFIIDIEKSLTKETK